MKLIVDELNVPQHIIEKEMQRARHFMQEASEKEIWEKVVEQLSRQAVLRAAAAKSDLMVSDSQVEAHYQHVMNQYGGESIFFEREGLKESDREMIKADMRTNLQLEIFLERLTKDVILPQEALLREYHSREPTLRYTPKRWHVCHIVKRPNVDALEAMIEVRKRLKAGALFETVADEASECQDEHGDLGWVQAGELVPEFEAVIFSLEIEELSSVFLTSYGYHVAKVVAIEESSETIYEVVEEKVKTHVLMKMKEGVINMWIEKALKSAKIDAEM